MPYSRWNVLAVWLFALPVGPLTAQTGVAGRVSDSASQQPLFNALVTARAAAGGPAHGSTSTGATGRYRLTLSPGSYTVEVAAIGYQARSRQVTVSAGAVATLDVALTESAIQLVPIVVSATRGVPEKQTDAPAAVAVVSQTEVEERPALTVADHLRALPAVDVSQGGLTQSNIVARGFNNIFSGATLMLVDNRYAAVPSLRVNVPAFFSATNQDIEQIEFVLGPGAALYGPNSAKGVLAITTKSPFSSRGTTLTLETGLRSDSRDPDGNGFANDGHALWRAGLRHAGTVGDKFGYKISGEYLKGEEWRLRDPAEPTALPAPGRPPIPGLEPGTCNTETGCRDFDLEKYNLDARIDILPSERTQIIAAAGTVNAGSVIEYTGIGAAQARDWRYSFGQLRFRYDRLFVQGFANFSNAGDTFLFRDGNPIEDNSRVWGAQVQHGLEIGDRETLLYGLDYTYTDARTNGTINGRNEADDTIKEFGAYVHSTTRLASPLDLVLAFRLDTHNRLKDPDGSGDVNLSPRAALVWRPAEDQTLRFTYNRAFSTPSNNNLFLDIVAGGLPGTPFNVRALGVPEAGFHFRGYCGEGGVGNGLCMRSPWPGAPATAIPAQAAPFWPVAREAVIARLPQNLPPELQPLIPGITAAMRSMTPPTPAQVTTALRSLDPTALVFNPVNPDAVTDIDPIRVEISNVLEAGYQGVINHRLRLAGNLWYESKKDFVGPLIVESPNVFLDLATTAAYYQNSPQWQAFLASVTPLIGPQNAAALTQAIVAGMAGLPGSTTAPGVPLGTVVPDSPLNQNADLFLTYRNFGDVNLWGADLAFDYLFTDRVSLSGTWSWVSDDFFSADEVEGPTDIALNASSHKFSLNGRYREGITGFSADLGLKYTKGFPINSGVYVTPLGTDGSREPLPSWTTVDVLAAYRFKFGLLAALSVQNLFNENYATFAGIPQLGRMVMTKLQYEF
ncbi:MAG TPA: TonB-dependent receptor [Gemmatimonadales bacterium]